MAVNRAFAAGVLIAVLTGGLTAAACRRGSRGGTAGQGSRRPADWKKSGGVVMTMEITSSAFRDGESIPTRHTCQGEDLSPPLQWSDVPEGARSLALICDDPDAPMGTWVHWVIYDIPPTFSGLTEGVPNSELTPHGAKQGKNDFGRLGYGGPCPPRGDPHRYFFRLYALDIEPGLPAAATRDDLLRAMEGHVVAEGQLMGLYQRQ